MLRYSAPARTPSSLLMSRRMMLSGMRMEGMPSAAATSRPKTMAMPCVRRTPETSRRPQYCATKIEAPLMAPNMAT